MNQQQFQTEYDKAAMQVAETGIDRGPEIESRIRHLVCSRMRITHDEFASLQREMQDRTAKREAEIRAAIQRRKYAVDIMTVDQMRAMLYYLAANDQDTFDRTRFGAL